MRLVIPQLRALVWSYDLVYKSEFGQYLVLLLRLRRESRHADLTCVVRDKVRLACSERGWKNGRV